MRHKHFLVCNVRVHFRKIDFYLSVLYLLVNLAASAVNSYTLTCWTLALQQLKFFLDVFRLRFEEGLQFIGLADVLELSALFQKQIEEVLTF